MWGHPTFQTPERITWSIPWVISGLERKTFLRSECRLGLQRKNVWPLHAWTHKQGTTKVPTCDPSTSTKSAIQIYPHSIWCQGQTRRRTRHLRPSHQISNQTRSIHYRHTILLWTSRQPNHIRFSQCNSISSIQNHRSSHQHMSLTPLLRRNPY